MDKQLLKAYIKTIVEDEVKRLLPEMLSEAVNEVRQLSESTRPATPSTKKPFDRKQLAQMIGYDGETITATTRAVPLPSNAPTDVDEKIVNAVTKDYSSMMKKLGLT
jgi:hypothetical protein